MKLGFTGTRNKPTDAQLRQLLSFLRGSGDDDYIEALHHGACVGADLAAHQYAFSLEMPIVVHPPIKEAYLAFQCLEPHPNVTVLERKPYFVRNRDIVDAADRLLAVPDGPRRPDSGTWHTINFAMYRQMPITVCWPDGRMEPL